MLSQFRLYSFDVCSLNVECLQKRQVMVTSFGCCRANGRGDSRVPTAVDPAKCGERWGRVRWRMTGVWLWSWRVRGMWAGWGC